MRLNKRSQVQNFETVTVVIILLIMISLGIYVYSKFSIDDSVRSEQDVSRTKAMSIALLASGLDELKCSSYGIKGNVCFDLYRLKSFSEILSNDDFGSKAYYRDILGNSIIDVKVYYPYEADIQLYSNAETEDKSTVPIQLPILVMDPVSKEYAFAIMTVRTYI